MNTLIDGIKVRPIFKLLDMFKKCTDGGERFCFILGSGASKQSGIKTGEELARIWLTELEEIDFDNTKQWKKEHGINDDNSNAGDHYSDIYEYRFELHPKQGYIALENEMNDKSPSCGYYYLARTLTDTTSNLVITTNFDSLTEDSIFIYTNKKPLVITHELLARYIDILSNRPIIAKIHRDLLLQPKSTLNDTGKMPDEWVKILSRAFEIFIPIVIGYGGNDGSLMGFLEKLPLSNRPFFWCYLEKYGYPSERIQKLVKSRNGYLVPINGFDEYMILLGKKMDYDSPNEHIQKNADSRIETFNKQTKDILDALNESNVKGKITKTESEVSDALQSNALNEIDKLTADIAKLQNARSFFSRGREYDKLNKYDEAIADYSKAIELDSNYLQAYSNRGFIYNYLKQYDEAIADYSKVIELDPNYVLAYNNRGFVYNNLKQYDKAIVDLSKAIQLDPNYALAYNNRGLVYNNLMKYDEAIVDLSKAIQLDPNYVLAYNNRGNSYSSIEKYDEAIADYTRAIEFDPNYTLAYKNLEKVYDKLSKLKQFHADYEKAKQIKNT